MALLRRFSALAGVILIVGLAGCTSTPKPKGVVTGIAQACTGTIAVFQPDRSVVVRLVSATTGARVASETVRSGDHYQFAVVPGAYDVVSWWGAKAVTIQAGKTVTLNIYNLCF